MVRVPSRSLAQSLWVKRTSSASAPSPLGIQLYPGPGSSRLTMSSKLPSVAISRSSASNTLMLVLDPAPRPAMPGRFEVLAEGVIEAVKTIDLNVPLVVRLEGTNVERGREILSGAQIAITTANDLDDAAQKACASVQA